MCTKQDRIYSLLPHNKYIEGQLHENKCLLQSKFHGIVVFSNVIHWECFAPQCFQSLMVRLSTWSVGSQGKTWYGNLCNNSEGKI